MRNMNRKHFARPRRRVGEHVVQNNLAYTPTQMMQLAEQGIAVSTMTIGAENFYDGDTNPSFELPMERMRGVDIADCWQAEKSIKKKAKKGLKNDIYNYGSYADQQKGE